MDAYSNIIYKTITHESDLEYITQVVGKEKMVLTDLDKPIYRIAPTETEFSFLFDSQKVFIECEYLERVNLESLPAHHF